MADRATITLELGGKEYALGIVLEEDNAPLDEATTRKLFKALSTAAQDTIGIYRQWHPYEGMVL